MSPTIILAILLAIAVAGDGLLAKLYVGAKSDLAAETQKYDGFVAQVKLLGDQQNAAAAKQKAADRANKEKADAEHAKTVAALTSTIGKLRRDASAGAGRGGLSAPAPSTASPTRTCFDPSKLSRALQVLDEGLLGIVETGSNAVDDLDNAKTWAQGVK